MTKKIYILHENGANSHYRALQYLCDIKNTNVIYREFSIAKFLMKSILKRDIKLFKKQLLNIIFLINLMFSKNKKIMLGIAPYDFRVVFLSLILRNHQLYYHTSWICWDRSFYYFYKTVNKTAKDKSIFSKYKIFLIIYLKVLLFFKKKIL
jgi:hypothetical protein